MKVYVAASSSDLERAKKWMRALREIGVRVTSDWVEIIEDVGLANPRDAGPKARKKWSTHDLSGVDECDVLWFLVPDKANGRGAYFEAGFATALGKHVIYSGDTPQSIFCAQGKEYPYDEEAFASIRTTVENIHEWMDS